MVRRVRVGGRRLREAAVFGDLNHAAEAAAPVAGVEDHVAVGELCDLSFVRVLGRDAADVPRLAVIVGIEAVRHL